MGAIHPRYTTWTLDMLAASPAIALVTPDSPDLRIEEHTMGRGSGPPNTPQVPSVKYRLSYQRLVVEAWLTAKGPEHIEVPSPSNAGNVRDAGDHMTGRFGHTHHIVMMHQLDPSLAKEGRTSGRRLMFLRPGTAGRYDEVAPGIALAPELVERVRERIGKTVFPGQPRPKL